MNKWMIAGGIVIILFLLGVLILFFSQSTIFSCANDIVFEEKYGSDVQSALLNWSQSHTGGRTKLYIKEEWGLMNMTACINGHKEIVYVYGITDGYSYGNSFVDKNGNIYHRLMK